MFRSFFLLTSLIPTFVLAQWPPDFANLPNKIGSDLGPVESECGTTTLPIHFNEGIRAELLDENSAVSMMLKAACSSDFQASHPLFGASCQGNSNRECTLTAETDHYKVTYKMVDLVSAGHQLACLEAPFYAIEQCNMAPQDGTAGPAEVKLTINKSRIYTLTFEPVFPFPRCDGKDLANERGWNDAGNVLVMMRAMCGADTCVGQDSGCDKFIQGLGYQMHGHRENTGQTKSYDYCIRAYSSIIQHCFQKGRGLGEWVDPALTTLEEYYMRYEEVPEGSYRQVAIPLDLDDEL